MTDRIERDTLSSATSNARHDEGMQAGRIAQLDDLDDFEIADGEPDPRGWTVKLNDGREVGEVKNLLVDTAAMEVRYLEIDARHEILGTDDDRRLLVPIGAARLDDADDVVHIERLSVAGLRSAPAYGQASLSREDEQTLHGYYGTAAPGQEDHARFFGARRKGRDDARYLTRSEEELAIGKRAVKAGEVSVEKHVETEHVRKAVPLAHEEVTIERRPVAPGTSKGQEISAKGTEVRIPVMAEELVVEKRAVPKEEIVISKHTERDTRTVEADLKKERIDVDRNAAREQNPKR